MFSGFAIVSIFIIIAVDIFIKCAFKFKNRGECWMIRAPWRNSNVSTGAFAPDSHWNLNWWLDVKRVNSILTTTAKTNSNANSLSVELVSMLTIDTVMAIWWISIILLFRSLIFFCARLNANDTYERQFFLLILWWWRTNKQNDLRKIETALTIWAHRKSPGTLQMST